VPAAALLDDMEVDVMVSDGADGGFGADGSDWT
jgi:hypothetical protein